MAALPTLDQACFDELTVTVRGEVYRPGDQRYVIASHYLLTVVLIPYPHLVFKSAHASSMETF